MTRTGSSGSGPTRAAPLRYVCRLASALATAASPSLPSHSSPREVLVPPARKSPVAKATGDFLAGGTSTSRGLEWLGRLGLAAVASALASRQTYLRGAARVGPLPDDPVRVIVTRAPRHATRDSTPRDTGAVARITHQAEIVRDSYAGLLAVSLSFAFTAVSALIGLATLVPAVLPFAVVPLAVSLALFRVPLPAVAHRRRT